MIVAVCHCHSLSPSLIFAGKAGAYQSGDHFGIEKVYFRTDATFEMRTVLHGNCLFIVAHKSFGQDFISNGSGGEESKIAERQRWRMCVRQNVVEKEI